MTERKESIHPDGEREKDIPAETETPVNLEERSETESREHNGMQEPESVLEHDSVPKEELPHSKDERSIEENPTIAGESRSITDTLSSQADIDQARPSEGLQFAGFWLRFWAYLIDLIVVGSITRILLKPILKAMGVIHDPSFFSALNIGTAIIFYLYFVLMTKYFRQTLGKMIFGLKVVSLKEDGLSWMTIIFREFIGRYISKTILVLYFLVGFLPKKQGLHDIFADTSVIMERKR